MPNQKFESCPRISLSAPSARVRSPGCEAAAVVAASPRLLEQHDDNDAHLVEHVHGSRDQHHRYGGCVGRGETAEQQNAHERVTPILAQHRDVHEADAREREHHHRRLKHEREHEEREQDQVHRRFDAERFVRDRRRDSVPRRQHAMDDEEVAERDAGGREKERRRGVCVHDAARARMERRHDEHPDLIEQHR
jgi:hypothetical protein